MTEKLSREVLDNVRGYNPLTAGSLLRKSRAESPKKLHFLQQRKR